MNLSRCDPGPGANQQHARRPRPVGEGQQEHPLCRGGRAHHERHHGHQRSDPRCQRRHHPLRCQEALRRAEAEETDKATYDAGIRKAGDNSYTGQSMPEIYLF